MRAFGKYRLVEPIASGGMAEVWRAEAPGAAGFVKEVALKLIRGDHDANSEFVEMFIREARLASRLAHGNIVQVFDFDEVDGRYYIAMELVHGRTLRAVVDRCRALGTLFGLARAVHVAAEIARALAYAHRGEHGGLVHRDVSPQNVLLSFEGEVKLADFGIARVLGTTDVTSPGTVKGKLAYMAPEQARGGVVDGRADIFSLGVILWELCTGRRLFARDSEAAMLAAVVAPDPVAPPSSWNETVPPELDEIVVGALARDPDRRTPSADALATALATVRLRIATSPEEMDVRALLARLWPDRDGPRSLADGGHTVLRCGIESGGPELTSARGVTPPVPVPVAAEEGSAPHPPEWCLEPSPAPDAPTRTSVESSRRRRVRRNVQSGVAAISVAAAMTAGTRLWKHRPLSTIAGAQVAQQAPRVPAPDPSPVVTVRPTREAASVQGPGPRVNPPPVTRPVTPPITPPVRSPITPAGVPARPPVTTVRAPSVALRSPPNVSDAAGSAAGARPVASPARAPVAAVGTSTLAVRALPWAWVRVDGEEVGETPFEVTLRSGTHRVQVHHPTLGDDEIVVTLRPGERYAWQPRLSRP